MSAMPTRSLLCLLTALFIVGCGSVDENIGAYAFTMTGTETQTAPTNNTSTSTASGTISVNATKIDKSYSIVVGQTSMPTAGCVLNGTRSTTSMYEIDIATGQTCSFQSTGATTTATISSGKVTITPAQTSTDVANLKIEVSYSYAGNTLLGNFAGTGVRTYAGPRL